jgi:hypothetical protein
MTIDDCTMGIEKSSSKGRQLPLRLGPLSCSLFLLVVSCYCSLSHSFSIQRSGVFLHSTQYASQQLSRTLFSSSWSPLSTTTTLSSSKTSDGTDTVPANRGGWFPQCNNYDDDDIFAEFLEEDEATAEIEEKAVELAMKIIQNRLESQNSDDDKENSDDNKENKDKDSWSPPTNTRVSKLVKGRFMDLTCAVEGERALESLFSDPIVAACEDNDIIRGTVMVVQSLCVTGTQVGVTGAPDQLQRLVAHLDRRDDPAMREKDLYEWNRDSIRRLKYRIDRKAALHLLSRMLWKRSTQGAYDLLVRMGVWKKHEDLALLRSGFPLRFTKDENDAAKAAFDLTHDPDEILGLRQDFRHMKVVTIDSASTSEIDDGLSVEVVKKDDGTERQRIWVHIADADRWAPRDSVLFETARKRMTSLYLPHGSIAMFPSIASADLMSLIANKDACALSLGVELNDDGSIDASTITFTPSVIRVKYRLTYDDVDEMLEEGIGYSEEWELGALLDAATKRRNYRISRGSSEGLVPVPVPYSSVSINNNKSAPDGIGISVNVQVSHNAGKNRTTDSTLDGALELTEFASSANLLVTEAMIMAGEALGRWKMRIDKEDEQEDEGAAVNQLRLPFRTQPAPDFKTRSRERSVWEDLLEGDVGGGLCHAWYARRFLQPLKVTELPRPHSGLGLQCYVQWSSPIRRFADLQTHASIKRYLRRKRIHEMIQKGSEVPSGLRSIDLGWATDTHDQSSQEEGGLPVVEDRDDLDQDLDFYAGIGLIGASRTLQRQSQQYWLYEHVRRLKENDPDTTFTVLILGCVDQVKRQYAVYVYELGLEHRYTSPAGKLNIGITLTMKVDRVSPRTGVLSFVRTI